MTTIQLRKELKKAIDRLPPKRLASVADFVHSLDYVPLSRRLQEAEKAISAGKGVKWRKVRSDV
jgi:hypothetical protein